MPSLPKVQAIFGQIRIRIRFDLSIAFDAYGAHTNYLVQLCLAIGFVLNRQNPLFAGRHPVLFVKPVAGFMPVSSAQHMP